MTFVAFCCTINSRGLVSMYPYRFNTEKQKRSRGHGMFINWRDDEFEHLNKIAKDNGLKPATFSKSVIKRFLNSNPLK